MLDSNETELCISSKITINLLKELQHNEEATDATWVLTSAFIIFTMQSGFGLLEAGSVSVKNECNIMVKNALDVVFGSFCYWLVGFGLTYGDNEEYSNGFVGIGHFLTDSDSENAGNLYSKYFFQLSFATTANTIVSGAMAERTNLKAYMIFSFFNIILFSMPAHWYWDQRGFLYKLGVVDVAGCGPVHVTGGVIALVATICLKPRVGVFENKNLQPQTMASPTNVVLGTFMLWWGWLGFNTGSTFGLSEGKWMLASRAAVTTINSSVGGGIWSIFYCYIVTNKFKKKLDVGTFCSCILGGLVSITACCAICRPWEAIVIGIIGGAITCFGAHLLIILKIDDPVNAIPVHFFCGSWGLIATGIFGEKDSNGHYTSSGVAKGGAWTVVAYQLLGIACIVAWSTVLSLIHFYIINKTIGLRISIEDELLGADFVEHGILEEDQFSNIHNNKVSSFNNQSHIFGRKISGRHSIKKHDDHLKTIQYVTNNETFSDFDVVSTRSFEDVVSTRSFENDDTILNINKTDQKAEDNSL